MNNIIHVQPALPKYRHDFFERLSRVYNSKMKVYYSLGALGALTAPVQFEWAFARLAIKPLPGGLSWQPGVAMLSIKKNDILVLSGNPRQLSTLILLFRAKACGAHVVWWGHYWSSTSQRWRQILRFVPMALADALLFYTDDEVKAFHNDSAAPRKKRPISALNNGINIDPILDVRQEYDASKRESAVMFIGRLTKKANLSLLFYALFELGSIAPDIYIVGDGEEKTHLKSIAKDLGVGDKIHWCGALTDESDISVIANRCKAFVYPGEVGLSLIHAMAYGLPAIVHNDRRLHMPEIAAFKDGESGRTFSHNNSSSLTEVIENILVNDEKLNSYSLVARRIVQNDYNTENMANRFLKLVTEMSG